MSLGGGWWPTGWQVRASGAVSAGYPLFIPPHSFLYIWLALLGERSHHEHNHHASVSAILAWEEAFRNLCATHPFLHSVPEPQARPCGSDPSVSGVFPI